jgi:PAS domain S-box-containing protein
MSPVETHGTAVAPSPSVLFERNPQPMWIIERDTLRFLSVNEAAVRHYGYSREEFLAMSARDLRPPEDVPGRLGLLEERRSSSEPLRAGGIREHVKKDRTVIDVEIAVADLSYDGRPASLVVVHDVTERLRAERRLARSERTLKEAQAVAHVGSWVWNLTTHEVVWSDELYRICGVEAAAFKPSYETLLLLVHPADRDRVRSLIDTAIREGRSLEYESRLIWPGGQVRDHYTRVETVAGVGGRPERIIGVHHDITERKHAERELMRQKEVLQTIFDCLPVMIIFFDAEARPLLANREFTRVLGWTLQDLEGRDFLDAFYPEPEARQEVDEFIRASTGRWRDFHTRSRGGQAIDISWASVALSDGTRIGIGQDVTDRKWADEERGRFWRSERAARAQAESALARQRQIQSVTDAALAHLGLDDLLRVTLARLRAVVGADVANVLLLSEDGPWVTVRASDGVDGALSPIGDSVLVGRGVAGRVAQLRQGVIVDDLANVEGIRRSLRGIVRSLMAAPLLVEGQLVGVLDVGTRVRRSFSDEDLRFLQMVADRVAPAIDRARLVERLNAGREQLSVVSRRLVEAQELERRELARELHDEVGQLLTGLKLMLETAGARDARRREEMKSIVNDLMTRVRGLSMSLRPPMLDDLGLVPALLWLVEHYTSQTGVVVEFGHEGVNTRFPPAVETAAFRIAQEALTNVARHAGVKRATMVVDADAERLCVEVRDEGRGFDVLATRGMASAGLAGMRERARLVAGRVTLESGPGEGTRVRAVLPLGGLTAAGEP